MMYKNGKMDDDYFFIGSEPNNSTYNIYKIEIALQKSDIPHFEAFIN